MACAGIVLAGGHGMRFGRPKAIIELAGRRLVDIAAGILAPVCTRVVVVTRPEVDLGPAGHPVVFDAPGPDAPLTGVVTGLAEVHEPEVLVLACDLPCAAPVVARLAVKALAGTGVEALVAHDPDGVAQPLCARYLVEPALDAGRAVLAGGGASLRELLATLFVDTIAASAEELCNVNVEADLALAAAILAGRPA